MRGFLAALMTLTRLPLWRVITLDKKYFCDTLLYWPLVGFITGGTTAGVFWAASYFMPGLPACILAIIARLLLTGAMHEDGLADFFDGFGGGSTKENILAIMKDSHIGSYGTIGLIVYFLLYASFLYNIDRTTLLPLIFLADVSSKLCSSILINSLPYARKEEESKTKLVYRKNHFFKILTISIIALVPFLHITEIIYILAIIPAILTAILLRYYLKKKIGGYTGDCCGACVLIIEQVIYCGYCIIYFLP